MIRDEEIVVTSRQLSRYKAIYEIVWHCFALTVTAIGGSDDN